MHKIVFHIVKSFFLVWWFNLQKKAAGLHSDETKEQKLINAADPIVTLFRSSNKNTFRNCLIAFWVS